MTTKEHDDTTLPHAHGDAPKAAKAPKVDEAAAAQAEAVTQVDQVLAGDTGTLNTLIDKTLKAGAEPTKFATLVSAIMALDQTRRDRLKALIGERPLRAIIIDAEQGRLAYDEQTAAKREKLVAGRFVLYRLRSADVDIINRRRLWATEHSAVEVQRGNQVHAGSAVTAGDEFPMLVTRVESDGLNGQVFLDGSDNLWVTNVTAGDEPGQFAE